MGVSSEHHVTGEEAVAFAFASALTLLVYFLAFGKRHGRLRRALEGELREAQEQVSKKKGRLYI